MPIRTNEQLLLVGLESEINTDPTLTPAINAIPTNKFVPNYSYQEILRLVVNRGIDSAKKLIGRETLGFDFETEVIASGEVGVEPSWGKLLEGCGFTKTLLESPTIDAPVPGFGNIMLAEGVVTAQGSFTGVKPRIYKVVVTTAGGTGVAQVSVACLDDDTQDSVENGVTDTTPISLGDEGATITFDLDGAELALHNSFYVYCYPEGIRYRPTASDESFSSLYFYHYIDGLLFKGGGSRGNVTLTATAGEIARFAFNFSAVFNSVADVAIPNYSMDDSVPALVEQANLIVDDDKSLIVENIRVESNNRIVEKLDVNSSQGLESFRINSRECQFAIDPEAKKESEFAFWLKMRNRDEFPVMFKIGDTPGNIVHAQLRRAVFDNLGPNDQDDLLYYGITGQARPTPAGNDNIEIFVC